MQLIVVLFYLQLFQSFFFSFSPFQCYLLHCYDIPINFSMVRYATMSGNCCCFFSSFSLFSLIIIFFFTVFFFLFFSLCIAIIKRHHKLTSCQFSMRCTTKCTCNSSSSGVVSRVRGGEGGIGETGSCDDNARKTSICWSVVTFA